MANLHPIVDYIGQSWLGLVNNGSSTSTTSDFLHAMPASLTLLQSCFLLWSGVSRLTSSAPTRSVDDCAGYKASNVTVLENGLTADLKLVGDGCGVYGKDLVDLKFLAEFQTDSRLHLIIYDKDEEVYQVPDFVVPRPGGSVNKQDSQLEVYIEEEPFSFTVTRKSDKQAIFTTKGSNIIFEDQYVRLRTSLPENPSLYGLGEHTDPLRLKTSNYTRTFWARDAPAVPLDSNLYGNHPVYYEHRAGSGDSHGVLLLNSNGMDIKINNDNGQYLEYNTLGGVLDFYFLAGPSPFDVAREYSEITGKAAMMPYWGFGFHQCRFGYKSVDEVAAVVANYSAANIPLETMWTDIDYMDNYKVFTLGANFPLAKVRDFISNLHRNNQHYIVMVDPAVAYQNYDAFNNGVNSDVFLKLNNGSIYKGEVWPGVTAFPDWFHNNTQSYWNNQFETFFNADSGVDIDALWIDMNEPSNFCEWPCNVTELQVLPRHEVGSKKGLPGRNLTDPKYHIKNELEFLSSRTARTDLAHQGGWAEYDTHNLYGTMMSRVSQQAMLKRRPGKRPMVITRSTFVGAGNYVGHWLGDNVSGWDQYIISVRHLLQFVSFFQVPMVGADVCGFLDNTTEELCARWTVLGAFYPFYRNHNVDNARSQEAYRWESVAAAARKAIDLRYRLLDYIYTAMYRQTKDGTPMLAPVWMHYPGDAATLAIETQFFYGPSLLISPVTQQSATSVTLYLPNDIFYDFFTFKKANVTGSSTTYSNISTSDVPVHIKGGSIIPARVNSANTTTALRKEDFELFVALDADAKAKGSLYLDDGESTVQTSISEIEFSLEGSKIKADGSFGFKTDVSVKKVTVIGNDGVTKYEMDKKLDGAWELDLGSLRRDGL
ncbi:alpha-glucosidase b [Massarina eburnea CBS 473.64]|uniref:Alpha-glucosidase b n=1 Tax=Massarina eburnea CBS 473.64 TaxID=1395130 RepID=A0A6A6SCE3_9PLEO|nr:alpha-glucosidase b [Massarina eburnea CBS 473.64]